MCMCMAFFYVSGWRTDSCRPPYGTAVSDEGDEAQKGGKADSVGGCVNGWGSRV